MTTDYRSYNEDDIEELLHRLLIQCRKCRFNREMIAAFTSALEQRRPGELDALREAFHWDRQRYILPANYAWGHGEMYTQQQQFLAHSAQMSTSIR